MRKFFLFFIIFAYSILLAKDTGFPDFVEVQFQYYSKMDDINITQQKLEDLVEKENELYHKMLLEILIDKNKFLKAPDEFSAKIFALKKMMAINKRAGNKYAVLRDEVKLKSYQLLASQRQMVRNVILALDEPSIDKFEEKLNEYVSKNQEFISTLYDEKYLQYLKIKPNSKVIKDLQKNIRQFYMLFEINKDVISYLYKFKERMYRLNKYSKYHLIQFISFIDSFELVQAVNDVLMEYGLDVIKVAIILFLILLIYFLRKVVLTFTEKLLKRIEFFQAYSELVVSKLIRPVDSLFIVINLNMIVYVYNDFSSIEWISKAFNIIYTIYVTYIFYVVVNTIAAVKLRSFDTKKTKIKKDMVNVGIKIINFIIILIGLLFALYFMGVDLTAVLSGLGIGGFALAFAAKDTISNFFGTISILFSDVFAQGDWIEIDGKEGVVVEIGLRVTTIRTFDNALIAIPNGTFASKDVKNWNKRKVGRRIKMSLGVKYDSKREDIQKAVEEIREMLLHHEAIATPETKYEHITSYHITKLVSQDDLEGVKKTLLVYLDAFGDSSINILVYCFSKSVQWEDWLRTKQDIMYKIMQIFEQNNLEFAFPSLSIYNETACDTGEKLLP